VSRALRTGVCVCVYKDSDEGIVDDFADVGSVFSQCYVNGLNLGTDRVKKNSILATVQYSILN
jgi:hypothetical protein